MTATLKVIANGDSLVLNMEALKANVIRYVGRKWDEEAKWFVKTGEPEVLPFNSHYVKALKNGTLLPADKATVQLIK